MYLVGPCPGANYLLKLLVFIYLRLSYKHACLLQTPLVQIIGIDLSLWSSSISRVFVIA